ncbi:uncharacterized protein LOC34619940 [Cyclospora cayetanensis]|uniref:Uncharacterized protein LOC34619940 n=1 Tax=Cyclospora cayetanensis TaxID=88456 RepID=A0A6P6S390_9EIME|nr:uncharacterized protein LOC34619940 [Cyclospora cayetanensis]
MQPKGNTPWVSFDALRVSGLGSAAAAAAAAAAATAAANEDAAARGAYSGVPRDAAAGEEEKWAAASPEGRYVEGRLRASVDRETAVLLQLQMQQAQHQAYQSQVQPQEQHQDQRELQEATYRIQRITFNDPAIQTLHEKKRHVTLDLFLAPQSLSGSGILRVVTPLQEHKQLYRTNKSCESLVLVHEAPVSGGMQEMLEALNFKPRAVEFVRRRTFKLNISGSLVEASLNWRFRGLSASVGVPSVLQDEAEAVETRPGEVTVDLVAAALSRMPPQQMHQHQQPQEQQMQELQREYLEEVWHPLQQAAAAYSALALFEPVGFSSEF